MKSEQFELDNVTIMKDENNSFRKLTMHICRQDIYGIICDSIEERDMIISFFYGKYEVKEGRVKYKREYIDSNNVQTLFRRKFAVIQKKSKLIESLSIAENICIFAMREVWVNANKYRREAEAYLQTFRIFIDLNKPVNALSEKERTIIELIKAYAEGKEVIVLADFSNFLQAAELQEVYDIMLAMQKQQRTFIVIEPFGDVIFNWANEILVIKDGTDLGCFQTGFINRQKLYKFLSNRKSNDLPAGSEESDYESVFELKDIVTSQLKNVRFNVGKGEILKIVCLDLVSLNGIKDIVTGGEKKYRGDIWVNGKRVYISDSCDMKRKGICYCKGMPYKNMLIQDMSVRDNLMLDLSIKVSTIWLLKKYEKSIDAEIECRFGQNYAGRKVRTLTHLQQLEVVYLKILLELPDVIFLETPFVDMDLHMKEITLKAIQEFSNRGIASVILTMNMADIHLMEGDTVYLSHGELVDEDNAYQVLYKI